PLVGAIASGALAVLVALVTNGFVDAALVLGLVVVVQQVEGNVLYPLLVGRSLNLHPLAILLALSAGTVLAGVVGALFAVPIAAVISTTGSFLHERGRRQRERDAAVREGIAESLPSSSS
ncbi:MAG: AI-2E family transporter, partial [Actinomycetota bacterium]|nr:AI-2E family transporter [Actinomycetota bacterium]